jgi:CXXX repeat modification system protein
MKKLFVRITEKEKNEIKILLERKNALAELAKILTADNTVLYEKMVKDISETSSRFQKWWDDMGVKYSLKKPPDENWEINFKNNEIFLVSK